MKAYFTNLQHILQNIILLYRNFFHWNISKFCIFLYANIVGFVVSLPFLGIIVYQYFASYSKLGLSIGAEEFLVNNIGTILITTLLILCIAIIFISTYTYGSFLMQNVYKSYLNGEKLPFTKNLYFSGKHFRTYMGILGWITLYLLAPIAVLIILIIPFGILAKMSLGISTLILGSVTIIISIALLVWFIHLMIRLIFSSYILLYSEDITKAKIYINESFLLTRKKVWKIIFLLSPFLLVIGIIVGSVQIGEDMISENRIYTKLIEIQKQSGQDDHMILEGFFLGNDDDKEAFGKIEKTFTPMKNDINRNFLSNSMNYIDTQSIDSHWWIVTSIFVMISFLLFEGLTSMLYISVYLIIREPDSESQISLLK